MAENPNRSSGTTFPTLPRRPTFIGRNINQPIERFLSFFKNRYNQSYCEGAFEVEVPDLPYNVSSPLPATFKHKALQCYAETFCNWNYAIPHSARWVVFIRPHNSQYLNSKLLNMKEYEPYSMRDDWGGKFVDELTSYEAQEKIGCIFCMGVSESGVSLNVGHMGGVGGNINGYLKSPISQNRNDYSPLEMVFKETNASYSQYVIRPWIQLAGYKGLHSRPHSEDIKAEITVFELAQGGTGWDSSIIRKAMIYHDCVPISLNDENLDYEGKKLIQRQVSWTYNYVTVRDMCDLEFLTDDRVDSNVNNNTVPYNVETETSAMEEWSRTTGRTYDGGKPQVP